MFFCQASDSFAQRHGEPDEQNTTRSVVFIDELLEVFARDESVPMRPPLGTTATKFHCIAKHKNALGF